MQTQNLHFPRWTGLAMFVGGLLLAMFWTAFTVVHGPTSDDQGGDASRFWSGMLALPDLLIALGVIALRPRRPFRSGMAAWMSYIIIVGGLILWALCDLAYFVPIGPFDYWYWLGSFCISRLAQCNVVWDKLIPADRIRAIHDHWHPFLFSRRTRNIRPAW